MATTGQRRTDTIVAGRIIRNVDEKIWNPEFAGSATPLTTLMNNMKNREATSNMKFEVYEDVLNNRRTTILSFDASGVTSTIFQITTTDAPYVALNSQLKNLKTGENYFVTAITAGGVVTVQRDFAGTLTTPSVSTTTTDRLMILGEALPEGGVSRNGITRDAEASYNYCQFFRTSVQMSDILIGTKTYGGKDWLYQRDKKMLEHKLKIELSLWLGERFAQADVASTDGYIYTTGGVIQHIKGNVLDVSGAAYSGILTLKVLDRFGEKMSLNGSDTKHVFCGPRFFSALNSIGNNKLRLNDSASSLGMNIVEYVTHGLRLKFVNAKKVFESDPSLTTGTLAGTGVCLDLKYLKYEYFDGLDTKLHEEVQENDRAGKKDEWRTVAGLKMWQYGLDHSYNASSGVPEEFAGVHGKIIGVSDYM